MDTEKTSPPLSKEKISDGAAIVDLIERKLKEKYRGRRPNTIDQTEVSKFVNDIITAELGENEVDVRVEANEWAVRIHINSK